MKNAIHQNETQKQKNKRSKSIGKEGKRPAPATEQPTETDRSSITGRKMDGDITGAIRSGKAVKPDILREDHPGLAK